jgi:hypothetical protein
MKVTKSSPLVFAIVLACTSVAPAKLPSIDKKPWENYFFVLKERKYQFGITTEGDAVFYPLTKRGEIISESNPIIFKVEFLESKSNGKFTSKKINPSSLKSEQSPAYNPDKPVTYSGTVTGDAAFEMTITPSRDGFGITGKITDNGKLTNPLKIAIKIGLRPYVKDRTRTDSEVKNFQQRIKRDKFEATIASGNRKTYDFEDPVNFHSDMPNGVESLTMRAEGFDFTEFTVSVGGSAKIMFEDQQQIVADGADIRWFIPTQTNSNEDILKISAK